MEELFILISKDERICRFRKFYKEEIKTISLYLKQIGSQKDEILQNLRDIIDINEKICIINVKSQNNKIIKKEKIKERYILKIYCTKRDKLKWRIFRYIKREDNTENNQIVMAFKLMILYQEILQKLYKDIAVEKNKNQT